MMTRRRGGNICTLRKKGELVVTCILDDCSLDSEEEKMAEAAALTVSTLLFRFLIS